eukprot:UN29372
MLIDNSYYKHEFHWGWDSQSGVDTTYCDASDDNDDMNDLCQYGRIWLSLTIINVIFTGLTFFLELMDTLHDGFTLDKICDESTILSRFQLYLQTFVVVFSVITNCVIWTEFWSTLKDVTSHNVDADQSCYFNVVAGFLSITYGVIMWGWMDRPSGIDYKRPHFEDPSNNRNDHRQPLAPSYDQPPAYRGHLPSHWEIKKDPNSGRTYYVNHKSKKSQWQYPINETQNERPNVKRGVMAAIITVEG